MDFIRDELYFEAFNLANELVKEVACYSSKKLEQIKCFDIENYVKKIENVEFVEYNFKKQLNKKMLGSTSKVYDEIIITTNKNLILERKNFTKMHEVIHYYRDIPDITCDCHTFSDMILANGYFQKDIPKEYRANVGSSILMANDVALSFAFKKFHSFQEIAQYFFMSKSALRNRIIEHLIYIHSYTPQHARLIFNNYYYKGDNFLRSIIIQ